MKDEEEEKIKKDGHGQMRLYPELADEEEPLTGSHEEKQM
jgi:hypothetical protein